MPFIILQISCNINNMFEYTYELIKQMEGQVIKNTPSAAGCWLAPVVAKVARGEAHLALTIREEMCNPYGNIHGGMMSLLIDEAIGWAIISSDFEYHYTTINLSVDYLYAASLGETITAEARIVRGGKKIVNTEVFVYNEKRQILAHGTSNLVVTSMPLKNIEK